MANEYRDGTISDGAGFVNEFGMGPADRPLTSPNYEGLNLSQVDATNALSDVVALAEFVIERLAAATGMHEREILIKLRDGHDL